jgi:long-chain acyl-CoA synthetase
MRTHRHLVSDAVASAIDLRVEYDERVLITFPMYHVAAEDNIVRHSFLPNTIYIKREGGFNPAEVLEYISKEHISRCQFVPTMIHSLIQVPDVSKYDLSSLRLILYAGSSMPVELLKKALAIFPCGFAQLYGQTESGPFTTVLKPEDHALEGPAVARLASSGKPALNYEIRIVDENDNDVPQGEIGEIIGRSEAMMIGYWQMPEETEKKLKNGWLHTGDLGRFDEEGYVYIVERKNDLIISGGVNVYPREIEEVLYGHPAVSEVSVIGISDEHWGEVVKAVVVLKNGAEATAAELIDFCGKNLAGFKKPKSVDFWKELPKSPQGKILKKEIRKHYE